MFLLWHFQEVIEAQEKTITDLLKAVKEQHDQLDNQKTKIKNLEEKVDKCSTRSHYILSSKATFAICGNPVWYLELTMQILLCLGLEYEYGEGNCFF